MTGFNAVLDIPLELTLSPQNLNNEKQESRTKITKILYDYIKENNLQNPKDRREIFPDKNLKILFELKDDKNIYFNTFQTHLGKLYINKKCFIQYSNKTRHLFPDENFNYIYNITKIG